jgi:stage II sporulation protein GA (sporulation sigma-E factor processing peptidase)
MIVYIDALIIENFIVNYFLLYITSRTVRIKLSVKWLALPAAIGAAYVITKIYPGLIIFTNLIFKLLVASVMILIAFRKKDILFNIKAFLIYMLYTMLTAGLCIFSVINQQSTLDNFISMQDFDYKNLMLCLMIIYMILDRLVMYIKDRKDINSLMFTVDIVLGDGEKQVIAFLDTGNELREPATNLPVMIIEKDYLKDFNLNKVDKLYIPYQVVNGQIGNLIGFKPKCIKIYNGQEVTMREVVIAFCENKLSKLSDYHALLSRGII